MLEEDFWFSEHILTRAAASLSSLDEQLLKDLFFPFQ